MTSWEAAKAAKRRLLREQGTVFKDWGGKIAVALAYPNSYHVGMSNLGFQTIYGLLNSDDQIVCERLFYPVGAGFKPAPTPAPLISMESQRQPQEFGVLAFSISYELDYFNIVEMIRASGIPLLASQRDRGRPLVIGGGPCVSANPEPLVPFFDAFVIGEGEAVLPELVNLLTVGIADSRGDLLEELAKVPGVYVPTYPQTQPILRQWVPNLDDFATTSIILTPDTEFDNMYLMEIARGCGRGCRFCLAGHIFRPMRSRSFNTLLGQAEEGLLRSKRLGLVGAAISDHPQLEELVIKLRDRGAELSVSSLRVKPLSTVVLKALAEGGTRNVSLAPEAGSPRLRNLVNKGVSDDDILRAVDAVARIGLKQLKLYFMVGLPTETDEEAAKIVELVLSCKAIVDKLRAETRMILNISPFVPKAGTPFQWLGMAPPEDLSKRISYIERSLRPKGVEVRAESVAWSVVQGVLARGDSRLAGVLASMKACSLSTWRQALQEHQLDAESYARREFPVAEKLPWASVDSGVSLQYLGRELKKARRGSKTPLCPPVDCHKCGVC